MSKEKGAEVTQIRAINRVSLKDRLKSYRTQPLSLILFLLFSTAAESP